MLCALVCVCFVGLLLLVVVVLGVWLVVAAGVVGFVEVVLGEFLLSCVI